MNQIIGIVLKRAAEGGFGPAVKRAYDVADGHKTQVGVWVTFAGGVLWAADSSGVCALFALDCGPWLLRFATLCGTLGILGIHIGQIGGALKLDPPQK